MKWSEYKNKEVALNIAKSSRQRNGNNVFILLKYMYYEPLKMSKNIRLWLTDAYTNESSATSYVASWSVAA
jgi:hypothetical protein